MLVTHIASKITLQGWFLHLFVKSSFLTLKDRMCKFLLGFNITILS
jgi:hypothetical protein